MADYVSKDAVRQMLVNGYGGFLSELDTLPTVDVAPVIHGEWIFNELSISRTSVRCSVCGNGVDGVSPIGWLSYPGHQYCGWCGAKNAVVGGIK